MSTSFCLIICKDENKCNFPHYYEEILLPFYMERLIILFSWLVENSMRRDGKSAVGRRELARGSSNHSGSNLVDNS